MKKLLKYVLILPLKLLIYTGEIYSKFLSILSQNFRYYLIHEQSDQNNLLIQDICHRTALNKKVNLKIYTPNWICEFRAKTFSSKEPETLEWIDKQKNNGVFFDIGANVGLYSLYYAATKKGNVYAFEPSVFNLRLLAKNIYINNLHKKIHIISNPLTEKNQFSNFNLTTIEEGGALSSFGVNYGYSGKKMDKALSYKTLGFSLDYLIEQKIIHEIPTMIKIDVDGIEHLILEGAKKILNNPICKTILIEVNDNFKKQYIAIYKILSDAGFTNQSKRQSIIIKNSEFDSIYNQIWIKK